MHWGIYHIRHLQCFAKVKTQEKYKILLDGTRLKTVSSIFLFALSQIYEIMCLDTSKHIYFGSQL